MGPHMAPSPRVETSKSMQPVLLIGIALVALVAFDSTRRNRSYTYRGAKHVSNTCRQAVDRLMRFT